MGIPIKVSKTCTCMWSCTCTYTFKFPKINYSVCVQDQLIYHLILSYSMPAITELLFAKVGLPVRSK